MRSLLMACLFVALCSQARAQEYSAGSVDYSTSVSTTPVQVVPASTIARQWMRVMNAGSTSQGTLWCSRSLTSTLAANAAGAFPLAPYGNSLGQPSVEEFSTPSKFIPTGALWCVSSSSTAIVTAEASPR